MDAIIVEICEFKFEPPPCNKCGCIPADSILYLIGIPSAYPLPFCERCTGDTPTGDYYLVLEDDFYCATVCDWSWLQFMCTPPTSWYSRVLQTAKDYPPVMYKL